ncbi:MAG TPA: beta-N-acetylhexosaminidase [Polyangia bacterium]|nr:beta-N-acetylhexosaminidase [Polyangia bacterium]
MSEAEQASAGDLLWVGFEGTDAPAEILDWIRERRVGGVMLFARNIKDPAQVAQLTNQLRAAAPAELPLPVAIDQEGGRVQRLRAPATEWPPMAHVGARDDVELTRAIGRAIGTELMAVGVNCNFAPCVDVHTNPKNPVIGDRAFGDNPFLVARHGVALARGLANAGVLPCGKHFPGHGDTYLDSHLALPRVDSTPERLRLVEVAPFGDLARAGVPLIMTAHVVYTAIDPAQPATLSATWLRILREELGFGGVVVSDDFEMKAIADHYGTAEAVVRAVLAGCDALLLCSKREPQVEALQALERAAGKNGELRRRIDESAARLRALRQPLARFQPIDPAAAAARFPFAAHRDLAASV